MPAAHWTPLAPTVQATRATALQASPTRLALLRAVQLAVAVAGTLAFIDITSIFAAVPDMRWTDRWQIVVEITAGRFTNVAAQLAVLHFAAMPPTAPRTLRFLRFACMVLLGAVTSTVPLMLPDAPTIRLGIVESTTTGAWSSLFQALLIGMFLVHQNGGRARGEEASRRLHQLQHEQRAARRRLVEAQLQAMQARVDPQMFFDLLDSVQRLYATDAPRAEALLDELIVFLRAALPRLRTASSTLAQEFELASSLFRLQALRSGAPSWVRITLPEALAGRSFPAGVLLPLLVDAQTAAIAVDAGPVVGSDDITVSLRLTRRPAAPVLAQVRETLAALYGSAAALECQEAGSHVETRITLADAAP